MRMNTSGVYELHGTGTYSVESGAAVSPGDYADDNITQDTSNCIAYDHAERDGSTVTSFTAEGDTTVELYYTRRQITLTWSASGSSVTWPDKSTYTNGEVYYGAKLVPPAVKRAGFHCKWISQVLNQELTEDSTMPGFDPKYTASWTANTYSIAFDPNGGEGTMELQTGLSYKVAGEAADILNANAFTRENYTFAGWNTKKDGSGTAYKDKDYIRGVGLAVDADGATVTLYAQW